MPAAENAEKSVEISSKSVEEAIEKGIEILGVSRKAVEITVIKEASRGLLGLVGVSDALVRVEVRPPSAPTARPVEDSAPALADAALADAALADAAGEVEEIGKDVLTKLLEYMEIDAQVQTGESAALFDDTGPVMLDITGNDLGLLIGRRGETLNDLQFLTRLIVGRRLARRPNLVVDVEGYKARRERSLIELARKMADQVRESQKSSVLEPMPPNERRIVHLALRDDPEVTTQSVGEGDRRKVMIIPKSPS